GNRINVETAEPGSASRLTSLLQGGGAHSDRIAALETRLRETLHRADVKKDDLASLQREYQEVATQEAEPVAQAIAKARVTQLHDRIALLETRDSIRAEQADLDIYRK